MSMKRSELRSSGKAFIQRMSPVIAPIFSFLESGSQEAYGYHDANRKGNSINNHLHCGIVRDHVCRKLDELAIAGRIPFKRIIVANSGIRVYFDRFTLKVLRPGIDEDGDAVLPEAKSDQQILFYSANHYEGDEGNVVVQNLVMLWQSNHVARSVSAWLACPLEGEGQIFCEEIPHPAMLIEAPEPQRATTDDDADLYQRRESEEPFTSTGEVEGEDE